MSGVPLWFAPHDTDDWYGHLTFTLGQYGHACDSFHFHVDATLMHETDMCGALARLLDLWLAELEPLRLRGGETYLPFDFADDHSLWLHVHVACDGETTVRIGASTVGGMSPSSFPVAIIDFSNTDETDNVRAPNGFEHIDVAALTCRVDALIESVTRNRDVLNSWSRRPASDDDAAAPTEYEWDDWDDSDDWEWGDAFSPRPETGGDGESHPPAAPWSPPELEDAVLPPNRAFWAFGTVFFLGLLAFLVYALLHSVLPGGERGSIIFAILIAANVVVAGIPLRYLLGPPLRLTADGYHLGKRTVAWTDVRGFHPVFSFLRVIHPRGYRPTRADTLTDFLGDLGMYFPPTYLTRLYRTGDQPLVDILMTWLGRYGHPPGSPNRTEFPAVGWDEWTWPDAWSPGDEVAEEPPPAPVVVSEPSAPSASEELLLLPEQRSWGPGTIVIGLLGLLLYVFMYSVLPEGDWRIYVVPAASVVAANVVLASSPVRDLVDLPLVLTRTGYRVGKYSTAWSDVAGFTDTDRAVRVVYVPGYQPDRSAKTDAVLGFFGVCRPPTYLSTRYRTGERPLAEILREWHRRN